MLPYELPFLENLALLGALFLGFVLLMVVGGVIGLTLEALGRAVTKLLGVDD